MTLAVMKNYQSNYFPSMNKPVPIVRNARVSKRKLKKTSILKMYKSIHLF
eukprot:CAMPEP_0176344474 /NCGR_PEP_ID=MMETSP0126-20121128/4730_1 /TAXON_ID=141414 ORGANISM="Strombidinopsis acuminatum, Strain SPMC142" /NCGR_SAMPLE_ID=MMETSP0126 /ASSEMBLY_ACC=CAM_ASM_000229 /LENGTH=49 /DNA_ID=CAMNT_0017690959 /DNA_START=767 /DNA_END=916 /DNA_ORIENTATION=-